MPVPVAASLSAISKAQTTAAIASAASTAASVAEVAGPVLGAVGALQQGQAAQSQASFQAASLERQATIEKRAARAEEEEFRRRQRRVLARQRALLGGSGVDVSSGTSLLVQEDTAGEIELQALKIRRGGDFAADDLQTEARLQRLAGRNARSGSALRAGSRLVTGVAQAFG